MRKFRQPFWYGYVNVAQPVWPWGAHGHLTKKGGYVTLNSPKRQFTLGCNWWSD